MKTIETSKLSPLKRYGATFVLLAVIPAATACEGQDEPAFAADVAEVRAGQDCDARCDNGWDYWGNPIPKNATSDGFEVCSLQQQTAICDAGEWTVISPICDQPAPYNTKFGVNSAAWFDEACTREIEAAGKGMGYYLEIAQYPSDLNKVAASMKCAIENRIIPILRICAKDLPCGFTDPGTYVSFLQQLDAQVGDFFYAIAGPNEPLSETWIPGAETTSYPYSSAELSTLGQLTANYMNQVAAGLGGLRHTLGGRVGLLSPVFNCSDPANDEFVGWMNYHGANFSALDAIGGNAYNENTNLGRTVTNFVAQCRNAFSSRGIAAPEAFFLTETGAWESDKNIHPASPHIPHAQAIANLDAQVDLLRQDQDIRAVLFFNAFDTNPDAQWEYGVINHSEWATLLDGGVTLPEPSCGPLTVAEDFEAMPAWTSWFDAVWGSAATWQLAPGGQSGKFLNATRASEGSSAKVVVYDISPNTLYEISIYMRGAARPNVEYWVETGWKLGVHTAANFDSDHLSWDYVRRFKNDGLDGNGNEWRRYKKTFFSENATKISVGFKTGSDGGIAPSARWDTLRIVPAP